MNQTNAEKSWFWDEQSDKSVARWFFLSAAAILAVTGVAKLWTALASTKVLAVIDPIVGIQFRHLMMATGAIELTIALVCLFSKRTELSTLLVAWLSTVFLVYRLGLWWLDWKTPCSCLGTLTDALHIHPHTADNIMKIVLAYLLIGSYGLIFWHWRQKRPISDGIATGATRI